MKKIDLDHWIGTVYGENWTAEYSVSFENYCHPKASYWPETIRNEISKKVWKGHTLV